MKMKILLIYPKTPDTFWSFKYALKFISKKASHPPLGLLTVAAILPETWEKRFVDMSAGEKLKNEDILWSDYIFVSAMIIQEKAVKDLILRCKSMGKKVVAGGPLFTLEPEKFPEVDHLLIGEAEVMLPEFVEDVNKGIPRRVYQSSKRANMQEAVTPSFHLIKNKLRKYATMSLQFSRGCPHNCDFCNIRALLGSQYRVKTVPQVIKELDAIYYLGWRGGVFFVDDNFIGNRGLLKETVLPAIEAWMIKKKYPFTFITQVSINLSEDQELMDAMARSGFDTVFIGIETPVESSLQECNKIKNQNKDLISEVWKIQASGLEVQAGFIVGFDNDPRDIFTRMTEFIQKSGIITAMVGVLNAPKGTALYERLASAGRITGEMTGDNTDISTNIVPLMGIDSLKKGYMNILKDIYSPALFYERLKKFLENYKPYLVKRHSLRPTRILAGLRSVYRLGIFGQERFQYWRMIFWCLTTRPNLFPLAVTSAIYGYHFRRTFAEHFRNPDL